MNEVQPAKVGENAITICHNILRINSGSLSLSFFPFFLLTPSSYPSGKALHILYGFITITIIGGDKIYRRSPSSQKGHFFMSGLLCTFSPALQTLPTSTCANIYFILFTYLFAYALSGCQEGTKPQAQ